MIYFDYTATTPIDQEVLQTYTLAMKQYWGNSSSLHGLGVTANKLLEKSIQTIQESLDISHDIYFTSGATESNNLSIMGICQKHFNKGMNVVTSKMEHPSVSKVMEHVEKMGIEVRHVDTLETGHVDIDSLKKLVDKNTILVSVMWVNNVVGSIMPIDEIIQVIKQFPRCKLHVDSVQAIGKLTTLDYMKEIDLISISTHKIYGPKGLGAMFVRKGLDIDSHLKGSAQQKGIRPGTVNVPGAVATAKSIKIATENAVRNYEKVSKLNQLLRDGIATIEGIEIVSPSDVVTPYILGISVPGIRPQTFMNEVESNGCLIATGAACSSKEIKPSPYLKEMKFDDEIAKAGLRISLSHLHSESDIDMLVTALTKAVNKLK